MQVDERNPSPVDESTGCGKPGNPLCGLLVNSWRIIQKREGGEMRFWHWFLNCSYKALATAGKPCTLSCSQKRSRVLAHKERLSKRALEISGRTLNSRQGCIDRTSPLIKNIRCFGCFKDRTLIVAHMFYFTRGLAKIDNILRFLI